MIASDADSRVCDELLDQSRPTGKSTSHRVRELDAVCSSYGNIDVRQVITTCESTPPSLEGYCSSVS